MPGAGLIIVMLDVSGPEIPLQVVSHQLHLIRNVSEMLYGANIRRGGPENQSEVRIVSADQSEMLTLDPA